MSFIFLILCISGNLGLDSRHCDLTFQKARDFCIPINNIELCSRTQLFGNYLMPLGLAFKIFFLRVREDQLFPTIQARPF